MRTLFATALAFLALASTAHAGTYQVRACHGDGINASWHPAWDHATAAYSECPGGVAGSGRPTDGMIARNTDGPRAGAFSSAMMFFDAPPGARVIGVAGEARLNANGGWQAGVRDEGTGNWLWCGANCSSTFGGWYPFSADGLSTNRVAGRVICGSGDGCDRDRPAGLIALRNVTVTVADDTQPSVSIAEEGLAAPGWHRGVQPLVVNASDNVGIRDLNASVASQTLSSENRNCDNHHAVSCPNTGAVLHAQTTKVADGPHTLAVRAVDTAGNTSETSRPVLIDNTAPRAVEGIAVDGGEGWRSHDTVAVRWVVPPDDRGSPVAAVQHEICPATPLLATVCEKGSRVGPTDRIDDLRVPGPGMWTIAIWLRDAAGNDDPRLAQRVTVGFDNTPPEISPDESRANDPARLRFRASDSLSGVAQGEVEIRRLGTRAWLPMGTEVAGETLTAVVDDEVLAKGTYQVRARIRDHAGNERSSDGKHISVPLRIDTQLAAGERRGKRLRRQVLVGYGRRVRLRGRLTATGGNPLAGREIEVFERIDLDGAPLTRVGAVRTDRSGRFAYFARRGPSRFVRFRYPGSPTIRARSRRVELRVRATTTMRSSRRSVVNGEEVTFRGRLQGRPIPPTGKLLELQAFSRGRWLTFATPRANPRTGRWDYPYRFAATRGRVRYRFRTRVPREAGYPFAAGASRTVRVLVRGL